MKHLLLTLGVLGSIPSWATSPTPPAGWDLLCVEQDYQNPKHMNLQVQISRDDNRETMKTEYYAEVKYNVQSAKILGWENLHGNAVFDFMPSGSSKAPVYIENSKSENLYIQPLGSLINDQMFGPQGLHGYYSDTYTPRAEFYEIALKVPNKTYPVLVLRMFQTGSSMHVRLIGLRKEGTKWIDLLKEQTDSGNRTGVTNYLLTTFPTYADRITCKFQGRYGKRKSLIGGQQ